MFKKKDEKLKEWAKEHIHIEYHKGFRDGFKGCIKMFKRMLKYTKPYIDNAMFKHIKELEQEQNKCSCGGAFELTCGDCGEIKNG